MTEGLDRLAAALTDRYRIERELGAGGMATVYLAQDLKHGRRVALKVLRPQLAAVLGGERFVQGIRTTAQVQHPHILPVDGDDGAELLSGTQSKDAKMKKRLVAVADLTAIYWTNFATAEPEQHRDRYEFLDGLERRRREQSEAAVSPTGR
jgi:hypothetical protein